jgi:thiamine-phosphate pyrophosphorylase
MNSATRNTDAITDWNTDGGTRRPRQWSRGLYLITPDDAETEHLITRVSTLLGHAALLQYRNKSASPALRRTQAVALRALSAEFGVPLIINDDLALASAIGADGVHLGEEDSNIEEARAVLGPSAIIGVSCYDDLERARAAAACGASYIAFGALFVSTTKPNARRASVNLLRDSAGFGLPRVAIGGITPDNARSVVTAGADLIAVISGVFDAPDPVAATQAYRACFD